MFFLKQLPSRDMVNGYAQQMPGIDPGAILNALAMMRDASLLVRRLETYFARHDLSQLRFLVLIVIDREIDRRSLTAAEIAERLDVSKPVLTRALSRLVADGLVASKTDSSDGRAKQIALTKKGKRRLDSVLPEYFQKLASAMDQTPDH